jgi:ribosomal protein L12E/L44/L45/RPP1/RPP2
MEQFDSWQVVLTRLYFAACAVGVEADGEKLSKLFSEVNGKDISALIEEGKKKLASLPAAGAVAAAPAAGGAAPAAGGAAAAKKEEKKKEESEEEVRQGSDLSLHAAFCKLLSAITAGYRQLPGLPMVQRWVLLSAHWQRLEQQFTTRADCCRNINSITS